MHTKFSSEISVQKWMATYCLANTIGMFLILIIMNFGFALGELFIYPMIYDRLNDAVLLYFPALVIAFAFIALTALTFWLPLNLYRNEVEVNRVCFRMILFQSLVGCSFIMAYPTGLINEVGQADSLLLLAFLSVISGILQGLILFPSSCDAVLKWLVISLTLGLPPFIDLTSLFFENVVSNGFILNLPMRMSIIELRFDSAVVVLVLLLLYLLPGLIISVITGFISGLIVQSFFLDELSPDFKKENSAT